MLILLCVLGLRHDNAAHLVFIERLADAYLPFKSLLTGGHQYAIALGRGFLLNAFQYGCEVVVHKVGNDDSDEFLRFYLRVAQRLGYDVRCEVMLTGILLNGSPSLC